MDAQGPRLGFAVNREVRRVPMGWQHPMEWRGRSEYLGGPVVQTHVFRALLADYPGALASWEAIGAELARREGLEWGFWSDYCLTGYQGEGDSEPVIHPYEVSSLPVVVRDADHLHELLTASHENSKPDPDDYMPAFPEGAATGWCMYEKTSEGTPVSPVFDAPELLARWLADSGVSLSGDFTGTYEQWLAIIEDGRVPTGVVVHGGPRGQ
jgi:hypothetical protein